MKSLTLGSLTVYTFGLVVALATAAALIWMARGTGRGLKRGTVSIFGLLAIPLGVVCARLALCLTSRGWYLFRQNFFFNFSRGGYLLYGAMAGCALAAWLTARITRQKTVLISDAAAAPAMLAIALGRLAEGLTGSGYGRGIVEWFDPWMEQSMIAWENPEPLCRFPFGMQDYYGEWHWSVYLLEALAAVIILVALCRQKPLRSGGHITLMLLCYAGVQTLMESLRADSIPRWGFVRINQLISALVVAGVLLAACILARRKVSPGRMACAWIGVLASAGLIMAMEFALEQKIDFLRWMRLDLCYAVMALGSLGLILFTHTIWKRAFAAGEEGVSCVK
ncbi:MAG: prolipoprotein diacylglyceryl transferase family protein [Aristaeellaceae bacterium]